MNIAQSKIELTQQLLATNDPAIIKHLQAVFATQDHDLWDDMPKALQESIDKGLAQADNRQLKSHDEVMKKYSKWLKK